MIDTIKETKDYYLQVDISVTNENKKQRSYQILNKRYGVVEIETFLLPQALKYIEDLQSGLDLVSSNIEKEKTIYDKYVDRVLQ